MSRFLCCADLHVGAGRDHRLDSLADQGAILDQIVQATREHDVDGLLIAGDVFHRPKPTPAELHVFARFTAQLERAGIPAIAVHGNAGHDLVNADLESALELFASDWLRVSRTPELVKAAGDVAVVTLPSVPVHRLVAQHNGGDRQEIHDLAVAMLLDTCRDLHAQVPAGWPSVLLAHWAISGASLPNGLPVAALAEPVLPVDELERLGFDAIIAGHIHRGQLFASNPLEPEIPILYCGSPMVLDFGEAGFEHGVWVLDLAMPNLGFTPEFVPLADRRFVTVNVDLTEGLPKVVNGFGLPTTIDETDLVAASISEQLPFTDAIVRVKYRATEEQHRRVDHQALEKLVADGGAHRLYGGIDWDPVRETRARQEGLDEAVEPLAAVAMWCAANEVDDAPAEALTDLTAGYLESVAA